MSTPTSNPQSGLILLVCAVLFIAVCIGPSLWSAVGR